MTPKLIAQADVHFTYIIVLAWMDFLLLLLS